MFQDDRNLSIRGYAQIDYNQRLADEVRYNGKLEVHRFVLFTGYRFNDRLQFISEIEVEHGDEIFIEQAYIQYKIGKRLNLRGGMMIIPMGIINEYHEPTTFHGVERPNVDSKIIPTTWRELALGLNGVVSEVNIRYQLYVTNGFLSHDGMNGTLSGVDGLRKGRQKGLRSSLSSPNFSAKFDYFGVRQLKLGFALYAGKTQSKLYDGLSKPDEINLQRADSSVVGVVMVGIDARHTIGGLESRFMYTTTKLKDAENYNGFTGKDVGSRLTGYYIEAAYDVLRLGNRKFKTSLLPFVRWEQYDTHANTEGLNDNHAYDKQEITAGISWRHGQSVSFKADYQWIEDGLKNKTNQLNLGIGVWF